MRAKRPNGFRMFRCGMAGVQAVVARSDHHFARHTHDQFGIGVIGSGAQKSASGRGPVEAGPDDVITVNPGEVHDGAPIGDEGRFWQMLYFDLDVMAGAVADIRQGRPGDFEFTDPVLRQQRQAATMRQLFTAMTAEQAGAELRRQELLLTLLAEVMREAPEPKPVPRGIRAARERIDDDPAKAVSLADLAHLAGLSQFQLLRAFDKATGLTPHAYLIQRRIQLARKLVAGGAGLAEAALASGFADQSHMTRIFTRNFGLSPHLYAVSVRPRRAFSGLAEEGG
ncbi:AraC family transcriptional regulator [Neorhizobium galegae]|uniref:AraC family transcriptional regulator n=1 Tax=Neorhizobium galegae TaxID=399 RepID=UPI0006229A20|nr:AraC family transcriptional regulator [Neorhizobium galegae]KAB1122997.1 AraC family transcriptional regulator [Neorhizobium galegae]MCQ1570006.1 AraC family transcriptional regulator [Neorhizobium galegae]MCQ1807544.1 AraC family transcriptional regulator [Neorhizobium galegae]CDZ56948.1 L-rhamnose operon transcriptional activator RhaR [Neorhizobium galegae bv. orientalis]